MTEELFTPDAQTAEEFKEYLADPSARAAFIEAKQRFRSQGIGRSYEHVLNAVSSMPWAIRPEMLAMIVDILAFRASGGVLSPEEIEARVAPGRRQVTPPEQGVAVIPVHGPIVPKAGMMSDVSGATSIDALRASFMGAMAAPDIKSIILDIDSPGGQVAQVPEFANEMRGMRGRKPVVAVANTQAASAAYWIAAQADEIVASPSALVGSIGVVVPHKDMSARDEMDGVKTTLISAGKHKVDGSSYGPLSEHGLEHIQSLVDNYYGMFVSDVAKGRGVSVDAVRSGYGEGDVLSAKAAVSEGLADRVGTLDEVIRSMVKAIPSAGRAAAMQPLAEAPFLSATQDSDDESESTPEPSEADIERARLISELQRAAL
jgi:signal peptide peptidase SppA